MNGPTLPDPTSSSIWPTSCSEFPAPIHLTTRPDLGDVLEDQLVTIDDLFMGVKA